MERRWQPERERSALATLDEGDPTPFREDREAPRFDPTPDALPPPPTSELPLATSEVLPPDPTPLGTGLVRDAWDNLSI